MTFRCPTCGTRITVHTPVKATPTCTHRGTPRDTARPALMQPEDNEKEAK